MIALGPRPPDAVRAFLAARAHEAMYLLDNLARHVDDPDAPRHTALFADDRGRPACVLGLTNEGMALVAGAPVPGLAAPLAGTAPMGVLGPAATARALIAEAGLADAPATPDRDEPQFVLDLADLTVPPGPGALEPVADHAATARAWRAAFQREALGDTDPDARAAEAVDRWIAADSHRVLVAGGAPLALTGFNATAPGIVQVGGVFTPPEGRGRGAARRAVALHLREARDGGAGRATLFAASDAAARAYGAIGFRHVGSYALVLFWSRTVAGAA